MKERIKVTNTVNNNIVYKNILRNPSYQFRIIRNYHVTALCLPYLFSIDLRR